MVYLCESPELMFAGGGAGFQKQSKPPWENTNANTNTGADLTPSWYVLYITSCN